MSEESLVSLFGTLIGAFGGILTSYKLMAYRIEQLEKKVDKKIDQDEMVVARVIKLEETDKLFEEKIKVANHRIDDLEKIVNS